MTQLGCFSMNFDIASRDALDSESKLYVSVPVAQQGLLVIKRKEKAFEHYRGVAHVKWVCIERNGELMTPPKRAISAADAVPGGIVGWQPASTDLPRAVLRLPGDSPPVARSRSNSVSLEPEGMLRSSVVCID